MATAPRGAANSRGLVGPTLDPFAPHRGPLGPASYRDSAIGNTSALVAGPLAARKDLQQAAH
jgi:hypothetical protein